MRRRFLIAVGLLMLASVQRLPAQTLAPEVGAELEQMFLTLPTGTTPCDGQQHLTNEIRPGVRIRLSSVFTWIGVSYGGIVDVYTTVLVDKQYFPVLQFLGFDHYAPFSGLHHDTIGYPLAGPGTVTVNAGVRVWASHYCSPAAGQFSQTTVKINYIRLD